MKIRSQSQLKDIGARRKVLEAIEGAENVRRKKEHLKRYEVYKDKAKKYVIESLKADGLMDETIRQMESRAANISFLSKVINKKARTYAGGVARTSESETVSNQISDLERLIKFNEKMKKSDRLRELHKNNLIQIVPENVAEPDEDELWKLKCRVMSPWQYDVIEDANDNEQLKGVILTDYSDSDSNVIAATEHDAGIHPGGMRVAGSRDGVDSSIADNPRDKNGGRQKTATWWTDKYHFVTDMKGNILFDESPEDIDADTGLPKNPIDKLCFVNNADEQDGFFWAEGGDDLTDGAVLLNKIITDMLFIAYVQGYGQPVITGKNLKDKYTMGPNQALLFDYDPGNEDPEPKVSFVSPNPPLDAWMRTIEQYTALLLTTNNLSVRNVAAKLDFQSVPSGVALMVEQAEVTDEVSDKRKDYQSIERRCWDIITLWHNLILSKTDSQYVEEFKQIGALPEKLDLSIQFNDLKPVVTEKEMLENIEKRQGLGLNEEFELIKMDQPDLTDEEAREKLLRIKKQKVENMATMAASMIQGGEKDDVSEQDDDGSGGSEDQDSDDDTVQPGSEEGN